MRLPNYRQNTILRPPRKKRTRGYSEGVRQQICNMREKSDETTSRCGPRFSTLRSGKLVRLRGRTTRGELAGGALRTLGH
jgi:hypothetical protein